MSVRLASEGAQVFGVDVNTEGLAETASEVADAGGPDGDAARRPGRRPPNAGRPRPAAWTRSGASTCWETSPDSRGRTGWRTSPRRAGTACSAVNVKGMFFLTQAALPHLIASGGSIVNIASNAGIQGLAYMAHYCATKGAVVQLTKALAMELSKDRGAGQRHRPRRGGHSHDPELQPGRRPRPALPPPHDRLQAMSGPEHIAALFALVASDDCPGIHGAVISVDGGLTTG